MLSFLDAFTELRKANVSSRHVCASALPSVRRHETIRAPSGRSFFNIDNLGVF